MAASEMPWLKWYPSRAKNSVRWQSLTIEERGLFHELYDQAALSAHRGRISGAQGGAPDALLCCALRLERAHFDEMLGKIIGLNLIVRDETQALVFPDFATHQRNAPFRKRRTSGAKVAQKWRKCGAQEKEEEVDKEKEEEEEGAGKPASPPPLLKTPEEENSRLDCDLADYFFMGTLNDRARLDIGKVIADYGEDECRAAMEICKQNRKSHFSYFAAILKGRMVDREAKSAAVTQKGNAMRRNLAEATKILEAKDAKKRGTGVDGNGGATLAGNGNKRPAGSGFMDRKIEPQSGISKPGNRGCGPQGAEGDGGKAFSADVGAVLADAGIPCPAQDKQPSALPYDAGRGF